MGDRFENTAIIETPDLDDYIRLVTKEGGTRRALASELAKKIVEEYEGSTLGGEERTIQAAIADAKQVASEAIQEEQTAREEADTAITADLAKKAYADGEYTDLHAGTANQILSDTYTTDDEPYHYRQTPSHAGTREIDEIVGGSVVWNQLVNTSTSSVTVTSGHKYVAKISDAWSVGTSTGTALSVTGGTDMVFDITQMFPTAIADHIYDIEQATAGAGVAWFRKYFPEEYYAYDAGTMRSVEGLQSHDMVGKNLLDTSAFTSGLCGYHTGETIDTVTASTRYCFSEPIIAIKGLVVSAISSDSNYLNAIIIVCYDSQGKWVYNYNITGLNTTSTKSVQIPADTYAKIRVICGSIAQSYNIGTSVKGQVQVEFGSTATEYEPYEKHSYPLDNTVTLRGIPQLVDGQLKWDGDIYPPSGLIRRRYRIETYDGTENWTVTNNGTLYRALMQKNDAISTVNLLGSYVSANATHQASYPDVWKAFINSNKALVIGIPDTITDATAWKNYLASHPLTLVYELATPTTEQAEPYQSLQTCSPYGTEEYVSTSIVPIGHYTKYPTDLKSIVEQIADAPSEDGTYTLKATVSGGVVTYSWESA